MSLESRIVCQRADPLYERKVRLIPIFGNGNQYSYSFQSEWILLATYIFLIKGWPFPLFGLSPEVDIMMNPYLDPL